eukprot:maker-scaffold201_size263271-snap-gene-1.23 protein:Tk08041 transcript:maker-scaffold201_size263271-snap-gene-1.23-mRNA-1 annotation:"sodium potassium calcium exchanger 3-like isoform x1"
MESSCTKQAVLRRRVIASLVFLCISYVKSANSTTESANAGSADFNGRDQPANCTQPAIEEFPRDFFSQSQRIDGGVVVHVLIALYLIVGLGTICDDFFVPVLEILCQKLHLKPDVAGATFMAAGTSSPEFFANIMGTFVTESDLGIGTIVGSAVFNIFGVIAVCGLFSGRKIPLDWYPITRDCVIYGLTVVILIVVLIDEAVYWYESLLMIIAYLGYILLMVFNEGIESWSHRAKKTVKTKVFPMLPNESTPLHSANPNVHVESKGVQTTSPEVLESDPTLMTDEDSVDGMDDAQKPWERPSKGGIWRTSWWILFFPVNFVFFVTIPDVRYPKCAKLYPLSFLMCMVWIGVISYVLTWMITIIGFTLAIPDSVMGLSFLAVGTSVPEVISSLIVCRQGKGSMAVSNSIGSNTFDILLCLGLPWLIKALYQGFAEGAEWFIQVKSEGLAYTVISLLLSLILLYVILLASRFVLSRTLGFVCLVIYAIFLTISLLFEMNVFFLVNLPSCQSNY